MYDLYSEFDIEKHKQTFINYLEVIIDKTGKVFYAVPSHQEKLIKMTGIERERLWEIIPVTADVLEELTSMTECIAVWNEFYYGKPNRFQANKLKQLKRSGVYTGDIPI